MRSEGVDLSANARCVLEHRYLIKDADGRPAESPEDLLGRVAGDIADAELEWGGRPGAWEDRFYEEMRSLRFLPNSPTLMNAGRDLQQLAACFVLPVDDSLDSIFDTLKLGAKIHQAGGGTGFSFSGLRPRGDLVRTTGGVASGPVSFIAVYDSATERIRQGSFRRGANMAVLEVSHPDIIEFVDAKRAGGFANFNLSVGVTEDWMKMADTDQEFDLINPRTGGIPGRENAGDVLRRIAEAAWETGDPGLLFLDRMNDRRTNPTPALGRIEATNPCGEQPLLAYEACILGSINLGRYVAGGRIRWDELAKSIDTAVRFLDNAVERSRYPIAEIEKLHRAGNRKIGLGVMGWADLLVRMAIPYDSPAAVRLGERIMGFVQRRADEASAHLAAERGCFPNWTGSVYGPMEWNRQMRNATRTTVAPTGTISILAGCSSGIEPLFALSYHRRVLDGTTLPETNDDFSRACRERGVWSEGLSEALAARGSARGLDEVPGDLQEVFATAHDIEPVWHARHQAAFQKHADSAVSKTINLPGAATVDDVVDIFKRAWELACKGITVFRDGCQREQVLNVGASTRRRPERADRPEAASEEAAGLTESTHQFAVCPGCGGHTLESGGHV